MGSGGFSNGQYSAPRSERNSATGQAYSNYVNSFQPDYNSMVIAGDDGSWGYNLDYDPYAGQGVLPYNSWLALSKSLGTNFGNNGSNFNMNIAKYPGVASENVNQLYNPFTSLTGGSTVQYQSPQWGKMQSNPSNMQQTMYQSNPYLQAFNPFVMTTGLF